MTRKWGPARRRAGFSFPAPGRATMRGMRRLFRPAPFAAALVTAALGLIAAAPAAMAAAVGPISQATAQVICDTRQGTGALTSVADGGYVLTVGHVPLDPDTLGSAKQCLVGFVTDETLRPTVYFEASVIHAIFDEKTDRDMAVLRLGKKVGNAQGSVPSVPLETDEFAAPGDALTAYGYPNGGSLKTAAGKILGYSRGTLLSDAPISSGYSGGPAVDASGRIVGLSERVTYEIDEATGQQKVIDYEFSDILAVIGWLDGYAAGEHDKYLTHADPARFDGAPFVARDEAPGCSHVVRTKESSTLYCLLDGPYRLVFPDEKTYFSWYPDFSGVAYVSAENLAAYRLVGNVTMKAGTLVKIQTDPKVYVVTDSLGTLRWVQTEERARAVFGEGWAAKVRDVADAFFADYRIAAPVQ